MTDLQKWPGGEILKALPAAGNCMTLDELVAATGYDRDRITVLIDRMNRNGLIVNARIGCYRRTPAGDAAVVAGKLKSGPKGPTVRSPTRNGLAARLWKALRMIGKGTIPELLEIADPRGTKGAHSAKYLRVLAEHGITVIADRRRAGATLTSPGFRIHILVRDLGPQAPVWSPGKKQLLDMNKGGAAIAPVKAAADE